MAIPGLAPIDGKLLGIRIDGDFSPCEVTCSIRDENELLPASSEESGNHENFIEGYKRGSITVNSRLLINASPSGYARIMQKNALPNQTFELVFENRTSDAPGIMVMGTYRIQEMELTASVGDKAEYNITFVRCGAYTRLEFEEYNIIINAMPAWADKPYIVDTRQWS